MGYEVTMFVVQHRAGHESCEDGWCNILGMLDLSKLGDGKVSNIISKYHEALKNTPKSKRPFWYDDYGKKEFKITEDKYGDGLPLIPIQEFLDALKDDNAQYRIDEGQTYRRYDAAIALLESFFSNKWEHEIGQGWIHVIPYGH